MSFPGNPHSPRSYGQMHLVLNHVAAAALIVVLLSASELIPKDFALIGFTFGALAVVFMYSTRDADEWIRSLWTAGANAGFLGAISWLVFLPFFEGFYDGLTANESVRNLPSEGASIAALVCFVAAHYAKRIRGV
ncbi:hypothetical protein [Erythrobacter sp. R86502]|uniref:hypothetical protein n=1 Tax=Erythrobacter sp. R86502 TaxID=3093846 RepID=UPI0036D2805F